MEVPCPACSLLSRVFPGRPSLSFLDFPRPTQPQGAGSTPCCCSLQGFQSSSREGDATCLGPLKPEAKPSGPGAPINCSGAQACSQDTFRNLEAGGCSSQPRDAQSLPGAGRDGKGHAPQILWEGAPPCQHLWTGFLAPELFNITSCFRSTNCGKWEMATVNTQVKVCYESSLCE